MRDYASLEELLLEDLSLPGHTKDRIITSDCSVPFVARTQLAASFLKKLCPLGNSKAADDAALIKFKSINDSLPMGPWSLVVNNEAESCWYDYFRDNLRVALEPDIGSLIDCFPEPFSGSPELGDREFRKVGSVFDVSFIREHMGVGPGAAQKADSRCMFTKLFESQMTYTNDDLIMWYRSALAETGLWADAEMQRFQSYGFARVPGGKIFFASKNAEISRTCCTEASVNMLIQKAIGAFVEVRLEEHFGISLSTQPDLNRELARIGSIDGSVATVDLISASDCMGLHMLRRDLPDGFLKTAILKARSERAVLPDGSSVELNMVSTMGNGFTFPLQTLLFACAIRACYQVMGFPCVCPRTQFGVFGDDLIVRRETYDFVCRMLSAIGFQVNVKKSFNAGEFRESCGSDYYRGFNVRGVFVTTLETPQDVCSAINRLHRWSARHGLLLPKTMALLMTWTRDMRVPVSESDDAGVKVPFELTQPKLTANYWFKYRSWRKRARKMQLNELDGSIIEVVEGGDVVELGNQAGLAVSFLSGHTRRRERALITETDIGPDGFVQKMDPQLYPGISIPLRDLVGERTRYKVVSNSLPFWDWLGDPKTSEFVPDGGCYRRSRERVRYDDWRNVVLASFNQ